jgi:lysophospholipase L1-like esterase
VVKIPSNTCFYKLKLPETISSNGKIRLRSTSISISNSIPFSIIPKIESKFNIVILGSSTAAGEGASSLYKSWVSLYKKRIEYLDPKIEVINLAVGGFTTFNIIPTGSVIPIDVNQKIDTFRNITAALKYLPKVVIVNLPSNDDTFGYSIDYQKNNYELIYDAAANLKTSIFICSPQPKKFSLGSTNYINHQYMLNWTKDRFREYFIDFWTDFADLNGFLKSDFDSGDLTHFNDAGHEILAQRVFEKRKLFLIDTSLINVESKIDSLNDKFKVFLDKFNLSITMSYFPENDEFVSIDLYNINGSKIDNFFCGKIYSDIGFSRIINHNKYKAGVYFFVLKSNNSKIVKKIIF